MMCYIHCGSIQPIYIAMNRNLFIRIRFNYISKIEGCLYTRSLNILVKGLYFVKRVGRSMRGWVVFSSFYLCSSFGLYWCYWDLFDREVSSPVRRSFGKDICDWRRLYVKYLTYEPSPVVSV